MKKDYHLIAQKIISAVGDVSNIANVTHCMTRFRVLVYDDSKVDLEKAKAIPGVLNVVTQNGEHQFVIGQEVAFLYEVYLKLYGQAQAQENQPAPTKPVQGNVVQTILSFIAGTFSPIIPVLIAGGVNRCGFIIINHFFRNYHRFRDLPNFIYD